MADATNAEKPTILEFLRLRLGNMESLLLKPDVPPNAAFAFARAIRFRLGDIYGKDSPLLNGLPAREPDRNRIGDPRASLTALAEQVRRYIAALEAVPKATDGPILGKKIFIGHGHSLVWLQLKDFIRERLDLPCDEFNIETAAGLSTTARLDAMLAEAGLAFIVMTAEEPHSDGKVYARPNVIHESGLFQGKLGTPRAIVLLEDGCSDFSNIAGLTQIRFPKDDLKPAFEEVRRVFEREGY